MRLEGDAQAAADAELDHVRQVLVRDELDARAGVAQEARPGRLRQRQVVQHVRTVQLPEAPPVVVEAVGQRQHVRGEVEVVEPTEVRDAPALLGPLQTLPLLVVDVLVPEVVAERLLGREREVRAEAGAIRQGAVGEGHLAEEQVQIRIRRAAGAPLPQDREGVREVAHSIVLDQLAQAVVEDAEGVAEL